jgi:Flp pilus assembly pilin Flp
LARIVHLPVCQQAGKNASRIGTRVWLVNEVCVSRFVFLRGVCAMLTYVKNFVREEEGATMVEYGLMVALIAVACIVVVGTARGQLEHDVL